MPRKRQTLRHLVGMGMAVVIICLPMSGQAATDNPLTGTWTLVAADLLLPDGRRTHDYGEAPKGLLMIDVDGRYSLQIYDSARPKFVSGQKDKATPDEYKTAIMGSSVHFGRLSLDTAAHIMTLNLEQSTYPNQEGTTQKRVYELDGDTLSYRVPPRPDGSVPVSVWRRIK